MKADYRRLVNHYVFIAGIILSALCFSCAKYIDDPTPVDTTKRWLGYLQNSDDTISVRDGYVYLSTHNGISANGTSITSNNKLKGDFEIRISYSAFIASGNYSYSDQLIFKFSDSSYRNPMVTAYLTNENIFLQDSTRTGFSKATANREGELYIKRLGSNVYSWMRAGNDSLFMNKTDYSTGDIRIELVVYSADNTAIRTSVHLDDIMVFGGGGFIKSNAFNENTIDFIR